MLTVLGLSVASSSRKLTQTHRQSISITRCSTLVASQTASCSAVEVKISLMISRLAGVAACRMSRMRTRSSSSLPVVQVLAALEMGEDSIRQWQPGPGAGDQQTETGQMMQLPDHAGVSGFAALVGPVTTQIRSCPDREMSLLTTGRPSLISLSASAASNASTACTGVVESPMVG
jgi:hypothetical protein